jgi:hypothetical protein
MSRIHLQPDGIDEERNALLDAILRFHVGTDIRKALPKPHQVTTLLEYQEQRHAFIQVCSEIARQGDVTEKRWDVERVTCPLCGSLQGYRKGIEEHLEGVHSQISPCPVAASLHSRNVKTLRRRNIIPF